MEILIVFFLQTVVNNLREVVVVLAVTIVMLHSLGCQCCRWAGVSDGEHAAS